MGVSFFFLPFIIRPQKKTQVTKEINTTFLLLSFIYFSKFEWVLLFFLQFIITQKKHKCGQKQYSVGGVNRRKKKNWSLLITCHGKQHFFSLPDRWQQLKETNCCDLSISFETSLICLSNWLFWKKKETTHWVNASEVVGEFNQKKENNIAALNCNCPHVILECQLKKKDTCFDLSISFKTRLLNCPSN